MIVLPLETSRLICSYIDALRYAEYERFYWVWLDRSGHLMDYGWTSDRARTYCRVPMGTLMREVSRLKPAALWTGHNHPGHTRAHPSQDDVQATKLLQAALATREVRLIDHTVVAVKDVFSMVP